MAGSFRLISRYDNLSVLVSLMSNMSMPVSFFVFGILTQWACFWGGLLHFQAGSLGGGGAGEGEGGRGGSRRSYLVLCGLMGKGGGAQARGKGGGGAAGGATWCCVG